jgi:energy-coupling factor transporter ATP-binding protein EcfA2
MTFTTRSWSGTAVLLCTLLLQNCQSNSLRVTQAEEPATSSSPALAMRQRASSGHLAVQPSTSPSGSFAAHIPPSSLSKTPTGEEGRSTALPARSSSSVAPSALATVGNSLAAPYHLPAAAMPEASHAFPLGNAPGAFSTVFTTSSGERVSFIQVDGQWRAAMQAGDGSAALQRTLPVVGSEDIGALLSRLQHQDVWAARSRIHVLAGPTPPYSLCVYLGKVGLLGGVPSGSAVEWRPGPHIRLSTSNDARTEVYHIPLPEGYRYWGYRERPGSVVQRASCTIRYVEANSEEEITRLEQYADEGSLEAHLSADFANVVNLGTLGGGGQVAQAHGRHGGHSSRFTHAALVVYVSTKQNRLFKKESKVDVQLEIGIEQVHADSPRESSVERRLREELARLKEEAARQKQLEALRKEEERRKQAEALRKEQERREEEERQKQAEILRKERECREEEERQRRAEILRKGQERIEEAARQKEEEERRAEAVRQEQAQEAKVLLSKKLANPNHTLSDQESIVLLTSCVSDGVENAKQVAGKEAVIVIGNTGAGKSTFVNYLLGCEMMQKTPKELGIKGLGKVVVVKSKSEGGRCDEIMPIGHSKTSKTFIPQIAVDPIHAHLAYCDCPGFLDNRGAEINIANAVNIKRVLQVAKSAKVLVLINYYSLKADRARGLTDMLNICAQLFGSTSNLSRFQDSLLLGITQVPGEELDRDTLAEWLVEDTPEVMQVLSKRLFLYDPLNRGGSDFWGQAECASQIALLKGIPESESSHIFQTVLTAEDEQKLVEIVEKQSKTLSKELSRGAYGQAGACWQSLRRLSVIDNIRVERMLHFAQSRVQHVVTKRVATYRDYVVHYQFDEAERYLSALRAMSSHFASASLELDLDELVRHRAYFEKKQAAEVKQQQEYREAQALYAADTKRLLGIIEEQKQEMESRLSALFSEHAQETTKLRIDMIRRGEEYDAQIAKLREENSASLRQQAERKALSEALSAEERTKLQETQAQLQRDYEAKLAEAEREKAQFRSEYEALLAQQEEAQAKSRQTLQAQIAQLSAQEATKKAELAKTAVPSMAFGPQEWSRYYGEAGAAPPLPADMDTVLSASCPFWPDRKVRDTHLLVLLPATVNGKPFTLNLLRELIKSPKSGGHKTQYRYYDGHAVKEQIGNNAPDHSYWLLMTRDVLPESRNKTHADQKALVAGHASRTGLPYELPKALEAAAAILTHHVRNGERLYNDNPWTYTRCQEVGDFMYEGKQYRGPAVVGGFASSGLFVDYYVHDYIHIGVAGFRKF